MTVKLGTESIRTIAAFEKITKVHARDCLITENCVYFLVDPDKIGLAIGKNGFVIKDVRRVLGKNVKVFGYSNDPETMVKNIIPNIKRIEINGDSINISVPMEDKVNVIGKSGSNINAIREILKRHFSIKRFILR
jgi:N utilization substance protein A